MTPPKNGFGAAPKVSEPKIFTTIKTKNLNITLDHRKFVNKIAM